MKAPFACVAARLKALSVEKKKAIAAALAVSAAQAVLILFLQSKAPEGGAETYIPLVVPRRDIAVGEAFKSDDFTVKHLPLSSLAHLALQSDQAENLQGLPVRSALQKGQAISLFALLEPGEKRLDPGKVPAGKRLHVVDVQVGRLASELKPGDRIDLLANIPVPEIGMITEALLEGVEVIAASRTTNGGSALSFHLTPDEVKAMVHASQLARFSVSLRNPHDLATRNASPAMTLARLLEDPRLRKSLGGALWSIPSNDALQAGAIQRALPKGEGNSP